jgi:hypothetical protein
VLPGARGWPLHSAAQLGSRKQLSMPHKTRAHKGSIYVIAWEREEAESCARSSHPQKAGR